MACSWIDLARRHWRVRRIAPLLALVLAGCGDAVTGPPGAGPDLAFAFSVAGGPAEAFDRADRLLVRIIANDVVVLDTVIEFRSGGDDVRLRVRVSAEARGERGAVLVELRFGQQPLFRGEATDVALSGEDGPVAITLTPVVAGIMAPGTMPTIDRIGGTVQLSAAAILATGDTIPGVSISWSALDPAIVSVTAGGLVRALAEGSARVQASAAGVTSLVTVRVQATVTSVVLDPVQVVLPVGASRTFTVTVRDAGGTQIQRVPIFTSSNTNIVNIAPTGMAQALAVGTATIRATVEGVLGEASVTVVPATPAAASNVTASSVIDRITLRWTDNASNETSYQIRRGPSGGARAVVATLPVNATTYTETLGIDLVLDYTVAACNNVGCSESDVITARTVPGAPMRLLIDIVNPFAGDIQLSWIDNSAAETRFEVESTDSDGSVWSLWAAVPADAISYATKVPFYEFIVFRVRACNEAGCSLPTNEEYVYLVDEAPAGLPIPARRGGAPAIGRTATGGSR